MPRVVISIFLLVGFLLACTPVLYAGQAPLVITHAKAMPPLSFLDETGHPAGLVPDLWTEWSKVTGIPVSFRLVPWEQSFELIRTGEADIIGGLFFTPERAMKLDYAGGFLLYSGSYFASNDITITAPRQEQSEPLGVIAGDYGAHYTQDNHPDQPTRSFADPDDLFESLRVGKTAFFLMDTALGHWKLRNMGLSDKFSAIGVAYERELHAAVRRGRNKLVSTINAGMRDISAKAKQTIVRRWIPENTPHAFEWWEISAALIAFILVLGGTFMLTSSFIRKPQ